MSGESSAKPSADVARELRAAHEALGQRRGDDAEAAFNRVLSLDPDNVEALHYTGLQTLARGSIEGALPFLERAAALDAHNAPLLKNLGVAYGEAGRNAEAFDALSRALAIDPDFFVARLHLAGVLEDSGREGEALANYYGAVMKAQSQGRWLSEASTATVLRPLVLHAMDKIDAGLRPKYLELLAPLRSAHGDGALTRVMQCLDTHLGRVPTVYPDPRQKPKFLFFPELPPTTYFDRGLFPWYAQLEDNYAVIREELDAVLADSSGVVPFLKFDSPDQAQGYLAGEGATPSWDAFFFYRHGQREDANCARCPRTAAIIDALPIVRIREHAPEICFSLLTPGTHILPHRGVTNTRTVTHFPLIVPENCALVVGGEKREWRAGECFTFDDTFEHEAWNRGRSTRVVMLMDCWNPYLTAVEREAVSVLVEAIGDFNRAAGIAEA
jgi:aspartate beta-hydroxylase